MKKSKKKSILIIGLSLATVLIIGTIALILILGTSKKDLNSIVGKTVNLLDGIEYCTGSPSVNFQDDFSKVYSKTAYIKVISIEEEKETVTIEITAPPLKDIMETCVPKNMSGDHDSMLNKYMADIAEQIALSPKETMLSTKVVCRTKDDNGMKIIINDDFTSAVYPDLKTLLSEVLINSLKTMEG